MEVQIADLEVGRTELSFDAGRWGHILETLRSMKLLDDETLSRMTAPATAVVVSEKQARKIGTRLRRRILRDLSQRWEPPAIPSYIVPIATSNGLWIDPALPLLNPPELGFGGYFEFAVFCLDCKGFSVGLG